MQESRALCAVQCACQGMRQCICWAGLLTWSAATMHGAQQIHVLLLGAIHLQRLRKLHMSHIVSDLPIFDRRHSGFAAVLLQA